MFCTTFSDIVHVNKTFNAANLLFVANLFDFFAIIQDENIYLYKFNK